MLRWGLSAGERASIYTVTLLFRFIFVRNVHYLCAGASRECLNSLENAAHSFSTGLELSRTVCACVVFFSRFSVCCSETISRNDHPTIINTTTPRLCLKSGSFFLISLTTRYNTSTQSRLPCLKSGGYLLISCKQEPYGARTLTFAVS